MLYRNANAYGGAFTIGFTGDATTRGKRKGVNYIIKVL